MANNEITLRIKLNANDLKKGLAEGKQALTGFADTANQSTHKAAGQFDQLTDSISQTKMQLLTLAGVGSLLEASTHAIKMADDYNNLEAKLKLVTKSTAEFNAVQSQLTQIANANRQSLTATVDLYSGIAPSLQKAGQSQTDILKVVDSVNKALVVGGSNAQGSAASILQLTQALGSGVLRGDEFNSIMENGRGIALMLADALKTDTGKLRELAEQGKLTAEVVTAALVEQHDAITEKFKQMPVTVAQSLQVLKNNLLTGVGEFDNYTGASEKLAGSIVYLSKHLELLAAPLLGLAAIYAGKSLASIGAYIASQYQAVTATRAKMAAATLAAEAEAIHSLALLRQAEATTAATHGMARLTAVQNILIPAQQRAAAASVATTSALHAQSLAAGAGSVALRGFSATLGLLGGPVGLALLAAGGLMYLASAQDTARQSVELADGSEYSFAESLTYVSTISDEYRTASQQRQKEIRAEITLILDQTKARKAEAEAQLKHLASLEATGSGGLFDWAEKLGSEWFNGDIKDNKSVIQEASDNLKKLETDLANLGKTQAEINAKTEEEGQARQRTALELMGEGAARKKAEESAKAYSDTIKQVSERLTEQRLQLEHGAAAAEYFSERLKGLSDAEARAVVGAGQYNRLLQERARLKQKAAQASGGLMDQYRAELERAGLSVQADPFSAARLAADKAISATQAYQAALEKTATTAAATGQAIASAMQQASTSSGQAIGKAAELVAEFVKLGWTQQQAAGIVANLKTESALRPDAVGDGGKAYGLAQWHPDRQAAFAAEFGKAIQGSTLAEQVRFIHFELTQGKEQSAGNKLRATTTAAEAGASFSRYYERPLHADTEAAKRAAVAAKLAGEATATTAQTAALVAQTAKIAPALQPAVQQVVRYQAALDGARVTQQEIDNLLADNLQIEADAILKSAQDHTAELTLTAAGYRSLQLINQQFNAGQRDNILSAEKHNELLAAQKGLTEQAATVAANGNQRKLAELDYAKSGWLSSTQVAGFASQKMALEHEKASQALERQRQQVLLNAADYKKLELSLEGYHAEQARGQLAQESAIALISAQKALAEEAATVAANGNQRKLAELDYAKSGWLSSTQVAGFASQKMALEHEKASQALERQRQQVLLNAADYKKLELSLEGYHAEQARGQLAQESANALLSAQKALAEEAATVAANGNQRKLYEQELGKTGWLSPEKINALSLEKISTEADRLAQSTANTRREALLSADAYRLWQLENEHGLLPSMAQTQQLLEKQASSAASFSRVVEDAFAGIGDAITSTVMTGKADWSGLMEHIIQEVMRLSVVQPFIEQLSAAFKGNTDGGSSYMGMIGNFLGIPGFHTGGIIGADTPSFVRPIPRYHTGGIIGRDEVPAILQKGEGVFTAQQMKSLAPVQPPQTQPVTVIVRPQVIIENRAGVKISQREEAGANGMPTIRVLVEQVEASIQDRARRGQNHIALRGA